MISKQTLSCRQYSVQPAEVDGWVALSDERESGPYLSRDMALRVTVADALSRRKSGESVRLAVKDAHGHVRAERCLCDRFPC